MRVFPLPCLLLLAACNVNPPNLGGTWREAQENLPGIAEAQTLLTGSGFDRRAEPPEPDGAALRLWLGSRRAHAMLVQATGERRLWRTPGGFAVATDGARVVATAGLAQALTATHQEGADPLATPKALLARSRSLRRQVDIGTADRQPGGMRFGLLLDCRLRARLVPEDAATPLAAPPAALTLLAPPGAATPLAPQAAATLLVEERCSSPQVADFTNRFWADAETGAVLRSEQWIGPNQPILRLEELAPG
jgi:hypothetical protein